MNNVLKKALQILPDEWYIKLKYFYHFKRFPDLKEPKTYNEKLQWMKLHDRKAIYTKMVDKYEMKRLISSIVGENYVIRNYGVWEKFDDICFKELPEQFVLKTTHDCGGVIICKDKNKLDIKNAKKFIEEHLNYNYFYEGREWPYKNVKPRIIAEEYLENMMTEDLKDFKIFTFDGKAKILFVVSDRQKRTGETKFDFFDMEFNHLDIVNGHPNSSEKIDKPSNLYVMVEIAEKLSRGIPHLRVDFYEVNGKVYVGELTFFHYSGMVPFVPDKWDYILGEWIVLQ